MIKDLQTLLRRERKSLLQGDLAGLASLQRKKAGLLARLAKPGGYSAADLEDLKKLALENRHLLEAALSGLKRVQAKYHRTGNTASFQTYTAQGTGALLKANRAEFERRS